MANTGKRGVEEVERLLRGYEQSGMTRRQYCSQQGIPVTTLDYHRRRRRRTQPVAATAQLVKVELERARPDEQERKGFTLALSKGRRIESSWNYLEQDLARLIRIAESV